MRERHSPCRFQLGIGRFIPGGSCSVAYMDGPVLIGQGFGQIKQARGFRQFLLRGVKKVRAEWAMICTTHNLLKLFTLAKAA